MAARRVTFAPTVGQTVRHLPSSLKRQVREALRSLAVDPQRGKSLGDDLAGLSSHRLGRYRIIYRVTPERVEVIAVGPRRIIYELAARSIKRERVWPA